MELEPTIAEVKVAEQPIEKAEQPVLEADVVAVREAEDLKKEVERVGRELEGIKLEVEGLAKAVDQLRAVASYVGLWKAKNCRYCDAARGVCMVWRIPDKSRAREIFGCDCVEEVDGIARIRVEQVPLLCALCPFFRYRSTQ